VLVQEPAPRDDLLREPVWHQQRRGVLLGKPGQPGLRYGARARRAGSVARLDCGCISRQPLTRVVAAAGPDRLGRQQCRFDRRADAFAAFRVGEPYVADKQRAVGDGSAACG
jgi:hypothetical protein